MSGGGARLEGFLPGQHPIDAYGAGGFRFAGMSHRGSILALPSGILAWAPRQPSEILPETLERLFADAADIDHVLVGTGSFLVPIARPLALRLADAGIRAEPMPTHAAAMTYNILLGERRKVAAALLAVL